MNFIDIEKIKNLIKPADVTANLIHQTCLRQIYQSETIRGHRIDVMPYDDYISINELIKPFIIENKKENDNMITIKTYEGHRINKTNNTRIKTYATKVKTILGVATVVCDEKDYDTYTGALIAAAKITAKKSEECGLLYDIAIDTWGTPISDSILIRFANRACGGDFKKIYTKWCKEQEKEQINKRRCKTCGTIFNSPEEAREHEKWHIENKKRKHEDYLIRKEAKRRLAETQFENKVTNAMKNITESTNQ